MSAEPSNIQFYACARKAVAFWTIIIGKCNALLARGEVYTARVAHACSGRLASVFHLGGASKRKTNLCRVSTYIRFGLTSTSQVKHGGDVEELLRRCRRCMYVVGFMGAN